MLEIIKEQYKERSSERKIERVEKKIQKKEQKRLIIIYYKYMIMLLYIILVIDITCN